MDFDRSLADQPTMAELVACFILTTWLLDAFNVVGYLWPSDERGSGKTVLLHTVADPLDYQAWPHDHRQLIDDLWALALAHLPTLHEYERAVNEKARLAGRTLEPWRAILAVAL